MSSLNYLSKSHEKMVSEFLDQETITSNYFKEAFKIKKINNEELLIWHLSNQYHQFERINDNEAMKSIHLLQYQYILVYLNQLQTS